MSNAQVLALSIVAAAIPTLFYVGLVYWIDQYEKEPWWLLSAAFLWGAVPSILLALVFNALFGLPFNILLVDTALADGAVAVFVAPVVEETVKALVLVAIFVFWRREIDSPLDGIIYGAMVGLGFAMVENVYYFVNQYAAGGIDAWGINVLLRTVVFGFNHALFTSLTGLGIAIARLSPNLALRISAPVLGWTAAVFLHFMHNLTVLQGGVLLCFTFLFDWGGLLLLFAIMGWALFQERAWLKEYLKSEVALRTLTTRQYQIAVSLRQRIPYKWHIFFARGWRANRRANRFFEKCSELAYSKHHYQLFEDEKTAEAVRRLRRELVRQLGETLR